MSAMCFASADISVYENSDENIYSITVGREQAQVSIGRILPAVQEMAATVDSFLTELVSREGKLTEVRFVAQGGQSSLMFTETRKLEGPVGGNATLPAVVREAVLSDVPSPESALTELVVTLFSAWTELNTREPLLAEVRLTADCGLLVLDDTLHLHRTMINETEITYLQKGTSTLYFTGETLCDKEGNGGPPSKENISLSAKLVDLAYRLYIEGNLNHTQSAGSSTYIMTVGEEHLSVITHAVLPEAGEQDVSFRTGRVSN